MKDAEKMEPGDAIARLTLVAIAALTLGAWVVEGFGAALLTLGALALALVVFGIFRHGKWKQ